jgi:hypothetical protein
MAGDERPPSSTVRSDVGSLNASNKPTIENTTSIPITADALASAIQYHIPGTISDGLDARHVDDRSAANVQRKPLTAGR